MNNQNNRDFADFCNFFRNAESEDNGKCPGADCDDIYQSLEALAFEEYSLCNHEDFTEFCDYFYKTTKMKERTTIFYDDKKKFFMRPVIFISTQ